MDTSQFLIRLFLICFGLILMIVGLLLISSATHMTWEARGFRGGLATSGGMLATVGGGLVLGILGAFG
jgi:hypothetical protein